MKEAVARTLRLDLRTHAGGADGVARGVVDGSVAADAFVPITAGPMETVLRAGKADTARAFARTELVLVYSPKSRFGARFAAAAEGKEAWWKVLTEPGLRIARSNPATDPSGRAILFALELAGRLYGQPDLADRVLGTPLNPAQVQPGTSPGAGMEAGTVDVAGAYRCSVEGGRLPFVRLPPEVNLAGPLDRAATEVTLEVGGKTFHPEPLVFYAAALRGTGNAAGGAAFVEWLQGGEAQALLGRNGFTPAGEVAVLRG